MGQVVRLHESCKGVELIPVIGIDILLEASTPEATLDSGARAYEPRCFPGTREQYIEDIVQWAIPAVYDSPPPIFWMNGAAGVGKSAVAQTSAERIKKSGPSVHHSFFRPMEERTRKPSFRRSLISSRSGSMTIGSWSTRKSFATRHLLRRLWHFNFRISSLIR